MEKRRVAYEKITAPLKDCQVPVMLSDETMAERKEKVLSRMVQKGLDKLVIYCDVEHSGNFTYLVGFYTRFEEALLVLDRDGSMVLMLGNENLNKCTKARFECRAVHVSLFSLPNQPNRNDKSFKELLAEAGIDAGQRVGFVGWKNMTSRVDDVSNMYDVPSYIVESIRQVLGEDGKLSNETALFIGENGARTTNNCNEIAHYEYGAALASDCVLDAMDLIDEGVSEFELGSRLVQGGQHTTVTTIASAGERFIKGNMFPTDRKVAVGAPVSLTVGYVGGSSSRAGYAVHSETELPAGAEHYISELAAPYFNSYVTWLENIKIGMTGKQMFDTIEKVLPRAEYHWSLCPGHLVAEEEWMSSPIYEDSAEVLQSGMLFQIDIIPSKDGMAGICAESTVVLADDTLKKQIREKYPEMWERMTRRIAYIKEELGIRLSDDVLPMCATVAYLRPFLLNKEMAFRIAK
jgi:Xaa-Pro aminopeptidase